MADLLQQPKGSSEDEFSKSQVCRLSCCREGKLNAVLDMDETLTAVLGHV